MWVSGFVSAHISPDVWVSHLSGMYLKFCPMPKSQSHKNISILNNSWIFLKFPLKHCLSLFILFQCFLLPNQGEHYLSHNSVIQCPISENGQDLGKSQVSSEWKTMKLNDLTIIRDIPQSLVSALCLKNVFDPVYFYRVFIHMQLCMCLFASLKSPRSAGQHILFYGLLRYRIWKWEKESIICLTLTVLWYPCIIHYYVSNGVGNPLNFFNLLFHSIFHLIFHGIQLWFSFVCTAAHCTAVNNHTMTHLLSVFLSSPCSARSGFTVCASSRGLSSLFVSSCSCRNPTSTSASFQQWGSQIGEQTSRSFLSSFSVTEEVLGQREH